MPELPEVETISKGLNKVLKGKSFSKIRVLDKKILGFDSEKILRKKINKICRRAKLIIIDLVGKDDLVVHLKMTGQLIYQNQKMIVVGGHQPNESYKKIPNKHTRVVFDIKNNGRLFYNDMRRFGWMKLFDKNELEKSLQKEFGPEPFSKDFSLKYFSEMLSKTKRSNIKKILMDQKRIAGIGNMYADESLYLAKLDPQRIASGISSSEIKSLYQAIIKVLKKGIKYQGASIKNYLTCEGKQGKAQNHFKVYAREGEKCSCGGVVKKIKLNGRGTHFCSVCQR